MSGRLISKQERITSSGLTFAVTARSLVEISLSSGQIVDDDDDDDDRKSLFVLLIVPAMLLLETCCRQLVVYGEVREQCDLSEAGESSFAVTTVPVR